METLADRVAAALATLPADTPPDAIPQAITSILNAPCPTCQHPQLKPIDLPVLVAEGLLAESQIAAMIANPLTSSLFQAIVVNWANGAIAMPPELPAFLQALRVAGILNEAQATAIVNRFDIAAIVAADAALPEADRRYEMQPAPWAIATLGTPATGSHVQPIIEAIRNGNP